MNKFESPRSSEAVLRYLDGDYEIVRHGAYVACAVTGAHIPLDELKYWSVARQEPPVARPADLRSRPSSEALPQVGVRLELPHQLIPERTVEPLRHDVPVVDA